MFVIVITLYFTVYKHTNCHTININYSTQTVRLFTQTSCLAGTTYPTKPRVNYIFVAPSITCCCCCWDNMHHAGCLNDFPMCNQCRMGLLDCGLWWFGPYRIYDTYSSSWELHHASCLNAKCYSQPQFPIDCTQHWLAVKSLSRLQYNIKLHGTVNAA